MVSDWEAESDDGAPAAAKTAAAPAAVPFGRKRFDDEDAEDEVKDDWEEEDEVEAKPDVTLLQPIKKKSTVKQKIKEREERERRRAELGLDSEDEDAESDDEDPLERRRREKEAQIKADVENAANLLGTAKIASQKADSVSAALKPTKLSTKEDWESFADSIYTTVIKAHAGKPGFDKQFVPHFAKLISESLRDVDCRKQSIQWKNLADEKTRLEKEKKLGGVKPKGVAKPKTVGTSSAKNIIDTRAYGDEALDDGDDLDFM